MCEPEFGLLRCIIVRSNVLPPLMSDVLPDDTRRAATIERLKDPFPKTRELSREVCALLCLRGHLSGKTAACRGRG
jgi:hypothetical protein